jgi:ubiquinone biosynthesis protein UbiJ
MAVGACHTERMAIKRLPRPRDPIALAKLIGDIATGQVVDAVEDGKDQAAASMGKRGGAARAARMTPAERTEAARKAAAKRWSPR